MSKKAVELINLGLQIIKTRDIESAELAYWANYKAMKLGHPEGASNLGYMHELGIGTPQGYENAKYWYQKTISLGEPHSVQAEFRLARLYQLGKLGDVDLILAKELYQSALQKAESPLSSWPSDKDNYLPRIRAELTKLEKLAKTSKSGSLNSSIEIEPQPSHSRNSAQQSTTGSFDVTKQY